MGNHPQYSRQPDIRGVYVRCADDLLREVAGDTKAIDEYPWQAQQARRYLEAMFGIENVWYRAPETFSNLLERWLWAVGTGNRDAGDHIMAQIEDAIAANRKEAAGGSAEHQAGRT